RHRQRARRGHGRRAGRAPARHRRRRPRRLPPHHLLTPLLRRCAAADPVQPAGRHPIWGAGRLCAGWVTAENSSRSGTPGAVSPSTTPAAPAAPPAYARITIDAPQRPTGYATASTLAPAGWTSRTAATGTGWWGRTVTVDRRDRTGTLLVRLHHEPAVGGAED